MKNSSAYALPVGLTTHNGLPVMTRNQRSFDEALGASKELQRLSAAVILSSLAAWCVASTVGVMFDFGYEAVKAVFGQPDSGQGVFAGMALWFVVMPFAFALAFGYAKQSLNGPRFWNAMPAVVVLGAGAGLLMIDGGMEAVVELIPWLLVSCATAYAAFFAGRRVMKSFNDETARRMIAAGIIASIPCGILTAFSINLNFRLEIALCAATLLSAAAFVAGNCNAKSLSGRLEMVSLAMLPIFIPLMLNVTGCALSIFADSLGMSIELGWRAGVSAVLLLIFTAANAAIGAGLAHVLND